MKTNEQLKQEVLDRLAPSGVSYTGDIMHRILSEAIEEFIKLCDAEGPAKG
jgi:hypothetical protein